MPTLTIVMYHYVRELTHSRYPGIKALTVDEFKDQVDYLSKYYTFISVDDLVDFLNDRDKQLPRNSVLLTFDDGYRDHFVNVFPVLNEKGIQGCFFPAAKAIAESRVLDVNKIHFVLATLPDTSAISQDISRMVDEMRPRYELNSNEFYYQTYAKNARFDSPEVAFIKGMLQKGLPAQCRAEICDSLFRKYVTSDEKSFSLELYMTIDQLKCMQRNGMYIGSHGYDHSWLDTLAPETQEKEVETSLGFLRSLDCNLDHWSFNYPYGAYNASLVSVLKAKGCKFGLTTRLGIADLDAEDYLLLPRLDTNDLPKDKHAMPNEWTIQVIG